MSSLAAFRDGMARVNRTWFLLFGVFALTFLLVLPFALSMRAAVREHLGSSLEADSLARDVNYGWWQEFSSQATGVSTTFQPTIIGFGAVLDNLSAFLDNRRRPTALTFLAFGYLLLWTLLLSGLIDRLARKANVSSIAFAATCASFFFRFLRLGLAALFLYWLLYSYIHPWLFESLFTRLTADCSVERSAFFVRVLLYGLFGMMVLAVNLIFDYAKIRVVVEDRRSMLAAIPAAVRFIADHPGSTIGLYLLNGGVFVLLLVVYAAVAPGIGGPGASLWLGVLISQAYLLGRLWIKFVFYGSQIALFQRAVALPSRLTSVPPVWPDSPPAGDLIGK